MSKEKSPTKKNLWDNSSMQTEEQWGNIQLPGLSDEELHSKNWNRITGLREYYKKETVEAKKERGANISKAKLINHPTKGIPNSLEQKEKISKALKGKKKPTRSKQHRFRKSKPLMTPDGPFPSTMAATEHYGYKWAENCTHKIKRGHKGWYWITHEEYEKTKNNK